MTVEHIQALESGSSPKIKKAAKSIIKGELDGYCPYLITALKDQISKPKSWQTQCEVIKAIRITNCQEALPLLKELINNDYESTILYKELSFAIVSLENAVKINLDFFYQSLKTGNETQIAGACAAILYKKIIPKNDDIRRIIAGISPYTDNEEAIITPRCYIASVAYLWPIEEVKEFLEGCKNSSWSGLVEIAEKALNRKEPTINLV